MGETSFRSLVLDVIKAIRADALGDVFALLVALPMPVLRKIAHLAYVGSGESTFTHRDEEELHGVGRTPVVLAGHLSDKRTLAAHLSDGLEAADREHIDLDGPMLIAGKGWAA